MARLAAVVLILVGAGNLVLAGVVVRGAPGHSSSALLDVIIGALELACGGVVLLWSSRRR